MKKHEQEGQSGTSSCTTSTTNGITYYYWNWPNWPTWINPYPYQQPYWPQQIIQPLVQPQSVITYGHTPIVTYKEIKCNILVNGNRVKEIEGKVYLEQTEFSIEMFNPNSKTVGVSIEINGKKISNSLLVLNPGQRIVLDRYLDNNDKFLFETYKVDNSREALEAIANNGNIVLKFYEEETKIDLTNITFTNTNTFSSTGGNIGGSCCTDSFSGTLNFNSDDYINDVKCYFNASVPTEQERPELKSKSFNRSFVNEEIETGKVSKGSKSDQTFKHVNVDFASYWSATKEFKLLPLSAKPITKEDLVCRCNNCKCKLKKNFTFCPKCGSKA